MPMADPPPRPRPPKPEGVPQKRPYDERATRHAWERFVIGSDEPPGLSIRQVIEQSWARSAAAGVDARGRGAPLSATEDALQRLRHRHRDLLAAAEPTFERAARLLEETAAMVILTNHEGVILETVGDRRTIDAGREIHLELGGNWHEGAAGTNGIGTALSTGQPVFVHAAEHFCAGVKSWTCAGAPVRDPVDRRVIGLVDISGPESIFQRHNLALSVVAAEQIERALGEQAKLERLMLLEACLATMPTGGGSDGIIVLDRQGRVIHLTERARALHAGGGASQPLQLGQQLVDLGQASSDEDILGRLPASLRPQWLQPLLIGGELSGVLLIYAGRGRPAKAVPSAPGLALPSLPRAPVILGESATLQQAVWRAQRLAQGRGSVLIEGETGVGKELFAQLIHSVGGRTGREPFIAVNCGAFAKDLLGTELFGHVAGAFTGATREGRPGRFELADGGTLCLDEIGELPLDLQPYLLRVLEEQVVYRLGDSKPRPVDVRLVALTNRNLKQEVAAGRFRRDLYYRIGAATITIPPLRARLADLPLLIEHFNRLFASRYGLAPLRLAPEVLAALARYGWPGNVRELRNLIESLTLMSTDRMITLADLPADITEPWTEPPTEPWPLPDGLAPLASDQAAVTPGRAAVDPVSLETAERQLIGQALARCAGNCSKAAQALGISRSTLYRKMRHYGLQR